MSQDPASQAAHDRRSADQELPFFFGDGIFGVLHHPSGAASGCWVICNPFGMERTNAHRLNFEWAGALARAGNWVLRFDYRGTGDSAGAFEDFTIHDYLDDIGTAVAELERLSGSTCTGLAGLRLGAGLAAGFAGRRRPDLALVMWEPVIDGRRYRDSLLRTAMANELVNSGGRHRSRNELKEDLEAGRPVSVDGFGLVAPMYESLATLELGALGRPTRSPIMIVQINARASRPPSAANTELVKAYARDGEARLETVQAPSLWLRTKSYRWRQRELFETTLAWTRTLQPGSSAAPTPVSTKAAGITVAGSPERPVGFDVAGERVWGILHEPRQPRENAPAIVMVAAGVLCRSGIFYTRLARDLAASGWRVLRFDPRGIGDSNGPWDCDSVDEVYCEIDRGALVPDTLAALDFMRDECGTRTCVVTGLCGGASTSIRVAAADGRVVGVVPVELPLKLNPSPDPGNTSGDGGRDLWVDRMSRRRGTGLLLTAYAIARTAKANARRLKTGLSRLRRFRSGLSSDRHAWFRERIGEDANIPTLSAFQEILSRGLPVFCIYSESRDGQLFEVARPGLSGPEGGEPSSLRHLVIPGKDHSFTMPGQSEALSRSLSAWLEEGPWAGTSDRSRKQEPGEARRDV
jgi:exosortase A-associated hydrolase 2